MKNPSITHPAVATIALATVLLATQARSVADTVVYSESFSTGTNGTSLGGTTPEVNITGSTFVVRARGQAFPNVNTGAGIPAGSANTGANGAAGISLASTQTFNRVPNNMQFTISGDISVGAIAGSGTVANAGTSTRGVELGFYSAPFQQGTNDANEGFTGFSLQNAGSGNGILQFVQNGVSTGEASVTVLSGNLITTQFYDLTYSVDTATGNLLTASFNGVDILSSFSASTAGAFTDAATALAGFGASSTAGNVNGNVDNFSISIAGDPRTFAVSLTGSSFVSGLDEGEFIGSLTGTAVPEGVEASTFVFVPGDGDQDNSKFTISGDLVLVGSYDFTQDAAGTTYQIRIKGTGDVTGKSVEEKLVLALIKDDDNDGLLDMFERQYFPDDLTKLSGTESGPGPGPGTGDFDGDGLSDLGEYNFSLGAYPGINPTVADSDGDTINDGEETNPTGLRPATNPVLADTDGDGLSDLAETNTSIFTSASNTGSNPAVIDTDADGSRDGFEVQRGGNPVDFNSRPLLPTGFATVQLTDDGSAGISAAKTYTHAISGGEAVTVNGVAFAALTPAATPANFDWSVQGSSTKLEVTNALNNWLPTTGGVTGAELINLFDSFTYINPSVPGNSQTYTLSGLTPGQLYQFRLYIRPWDATGGFGRPLDLTFTNGSTVEQPFGGLFEDRTNLVLNNDNIHSAYYLSYTYVAETTQLLVKAQVFSSPVIAPDTNSGSLHLYGLTNEVVAPAGSELRITATSRNGSGDFVIDFMGAASTTYNVTKSPDLVTPFGPLTVPLTSTTNPAGVGQAIVPFAETSEPKEFYRLEKQP